MFLFLSYLNNNDVSLSIENRFGFKKRSLIYDFSRMLNCRIFKDVIDKIWVDEMWKRRVFGKYWGKEKCTAGYGKETIQIYTIFKGAQRGARRWYSVEDFKPASRRLTKTNNNNCYHLKFNSDILIFRRSYILLTKGWMVLKFGIESALPSWPWYTAYRNSNRHFIMELRLRLRKPLVVSAV